MSVTRTSAPNSPVHTWKPIPRKSALDKFLGVFAVVGHFPLLAVLILHLAASFNWVDLAK